MFRTPDSNSEDTCSITYGHLEGSISPGRLAELLTEQGLTVEANRYCVRVKNCSHFKIEFCGDTVLLDADASSPEEMIKDAQLLSAALTRARIQHSFEVYDCHDKLVAHLHHSR